MKILSYISLIVLFNINNRYNTLYDPVNYSIRRQVSMIKVFLVTYIPSV